MLHCRHCWTFGNYAGSYLAWQALHVYYLMYHILSEEYSDSDNFFLSRNTLEKLKPLLSLSWFYFVSSCLKDFLEYVLITH